MEYINSLYTLREYQQAAADPYFVDKSDLIGDVVDLIRCGMRYQCVSWPRRFGKTRGANLVAAFFGKAGAPKAYFASQKIGANPQAMQYCGKCDVVYLNGSAVSEEHLDGRTYTRRIEARLMQDLMELYPDVSFSLDEHIVWAFEAILRAHKDARLVFVMDDWDYFPTQPWVSKEDVETYMSFLRFMLKDEPIFTLAYFTGLVPMQAFPGWPEVDMFLQLTMMHSCRLNAGFAFTEEEVDALYQRYRSTCSDPNITREDLQAWYGGYDCASDLRLYNPQSVVLALKKTASQTTGTGTVPRMRTSAPSLPLCPAPEKTSHVSSPGKPSPSIIRGALPALQTTSTGTTSSRRWWCSGTSASMRARCISRTGN